MVVDAIVLRQEATWLVLFTQTDSSDVALTLLKALCREIVGDEIIIVVW